MRKFFGTDGVRGLANQFPMTPELALALGQAIAHHFKHEKTTHRIIIGKDTRRSSYMIEQAIAAGVCSMGSNAVLTGPLPSPAVAFLTKAMRADAGIMISASHNPFHDNGIKFFDRDGYKLNDEIELKLEKFIEEKLEKMERPTGAEIGKAFRIEDAQGRYIEFVKKSFPRKLSLDGLKIVVDCAHGAAYQIAPNALWELGAEVISVAVKPNGTNINKDCGAVHPEEMKKAVLEHNADVGIALDGDADRVVMCDEKGNLVDGDQVIALCALQLLEENRLRKNTVVGTIMTNLGVENFLKDRGISMVRTTVGDRYIIEEMKNENFSLGGEPSGHVIFLDHATTGDGLVAALQVLATIVKEKRPLSALVKSIPLYPQVKSNIRVKEKKPLESVPEIKAALDSLDQRLNGLGRSVVRYSGTEPLLRLMIEGKEKTVIKNELEKLSAIILQYLGQTQCSQVPQQEIKRA